MTEFDLQKSWSDIGDIGKAGAINPKCITCHTSIRTVSAIYLVLASTRRCCVQNTIIVCANCNCDMVFWIFKFEKKFVARCMESSPIMLTDVNPYVGKYHIFLRLRWYVCLRHCMDCWLHSWRCQHIASALEQTGWNPCFHRPICL